jgi:hypothetical protein
VVASARLVPAEISPTLSEKLQPKIVLYLSPIKQTSQKKLLGLIYHMKPIIVVSEHASHVFA